MDNISHFCLPYKIVAEHFKNNNNNKKNINKKEDRNQSLNNNKEEQRQAKRMCTTTLIYYFISIVMTIYALSLAIDRIQDTQSNKVTSMLFILFAIFCSPCYLLFELIMNMTSSSNNISGLSNNMSSLSNNMPNSLSNFRNSRILLIRQ